MACAVARRAQTKVSIFSAQQYVENYLAPPFRAAGYANLNFIDVSRAGLPFGWCWVL